MRSRGGDGFGDQLLQDLAIHIREFLDIHAALAGGVLPELREQRLRVAGRPQSVKNIGGLSRGKTHDRHVALTAALVFVVVGSETDDRRSPHLRLFAGGALHKLGELLRVGPFGGVRKRVDECCDTEFGGLGFVVRHCSCLSLSSEGYTGGKERRNSAT